MPNIAFPVVTSCWRIKNTLQSSPIELRPRQSSAKVIDTFAFGSAYEMEEFLLRMYEMGEEVSEFHIVKSRVIVIFSEDRNHTSSRQS